MNFAGEYAQACHETIHRNIEKALKLRRIARVENHHNFAWKEVYDGDEYIVHRKGATPAAKGVLGIIPGSMADKGFIVRGKGVSESLNSASHGAGRAMSRNSAKEKFTRAQLKNYLDRNGVELIGGDIDESPMAYKSIYQVIEAQKDLIEVVGTFTPKIVRMADKEMSYNNRCAISIFHIIRSIC